MLRFRTILSILGGVIWLCAGLSHSAVLAAPSNLPVVIESNEQGLILEWQPTPYQLKSVQIGPNWYSQIELAGLALVGSPGHPELPLYSTLIGLPSVGEVELHLVDLQQERVSLPYPILSAAVPQVVQVDWSNLQSLRTAPPTERLPDEAIYQQDAFYPPAVAELGEPELLRQRRVVPLKIYPLQVNPVTHEMMVVRSLRLEIRFSQPATIDGNAARLKPGVFDRALQTTLINPQALQWTTISPQATPGQNRAEFAPINGNSLKVVVTEPGLYAVTYADLAAAGAPVDALDPRTFRLYHGSNAQEAAFIVEGEADGKFGPGERLLFYAEPAFSRYTAEDVYFLSYGQGLGLRMTTRSGSPAGLSAGNSWVTVEAEENHYYDSLYEGHDGDRWYWDQLRQPDKVLGNYPIALPVSPKANTPATLTIWVRGFTNPNSSPDHRLAVSINGTALGEQIWDGAQAIQASFSVPANALLPGQNTVSFSLPGLSGVAVEGVWLDAFALRYATISGQTGQLRFSGESGKKAYTLSDWSTNALRVFDITNPLTPRLVSGVQVTSAGATFTLTMGDAASATAGYLVVPENAIRSPLRLDLVRLLADPVGGADYIMITPPDFAGAITPLADHRRSLGLRVQVVDIRAIYDTFGGGRLNPEAIRTFLAHAYTNWTGTAPQYVLLVGDGTYDFKNYAGWNAKNFVPPYLFDVDPSLHETATDNRYATFGSNNLPSLLVGRLSVETAAEAATVVHKIIQYETQPFPGDWNGHYLFVGDDPDGYLPTYAGDFHFEGDRWYEQLQPPFSGHRYYLSSASNGEDYIYSDPVALRNAFLDRINRGAGLVIFHGHSSWHQWAKDQLLRWNRVAEFNDIWNMKNGTRLPMILAMTCFTGYFQHPEYPTLDESLQRQSAGGAIAVWGSTGLGIETGHRSIQDGFLQSILQDGETNLGAATLAGRMKLYATQEHLDLLDTFILFGDPAMDLNMTVRPLEKQTYLPLVAR